MSIICSIEALVSKAAKSHKGLYRGKKELIRDIIILLAGAKPAVLLDYVTASPKLIGELLHSVKALSCSTEGKSMQS